MSLTEKTSSTSSILKKGNPPSSKESEMMVLGCMLSGINALNTVSELLEEDDFYYLEHKLIFRVLKTAYKQDKPADIHLVAEELKRLNKLDVVGGISYITLLAQYAGTSAYVEEYADVVKSKAVLRNMIGAAQTIEKLSTENTVEVKEILEEAQKLFFQIGQNASRQSGLTITELLQGHGNHLSKAYLHDLQAKQEEFRIHGKNRSRITGIPTYFNDLDQLINGINNSNLMILAARPAMGKTALALNIAENICFKHNVPVGIFSLEMTADQLLHRIICSQSDVESRKISIGDLSGSDFQRIVQAVGEMQKHVMIIDDQPGLRISDLRARARRMKASHDIQFLVIDYLQLLSGSGSARMAENRQNEISEISRLLKTLARELDIPILCLSQLSRKVEDRANHRPMMSDLRESGCLTRDTAIQVGVDASHHIPMETLAENFSGKPSSSFTLTSNLCFKPSYMTNIFYSGKKIVFKLTTENGFVIRASGNHPFLTPLGWQALETLQPGHFLGIGPANHFPILQWDQVKSIKEQGIEDVYDATVPGSHNFLANGFAVHNSIEQDSDIVMFLLRREYYDPHDKPGMAELIVAKNRHGGVGNISLTFEKELARFRNYTPMAMEF
ncbi:replicative DNA helicase [Candidatus Clavichlamydia salmonicola]|uniref:replicative DNA helicase n=1 Tax=Candidatus Clavichlamydia salmonicola TaxID=469812 RepID=UPI0018918216|nr:replicative DNA helicase [Candidatus Clavichlamydia salmonicola]